MLLGLPFTLLLPGYTLVALLYPGSEETGSIERLVISFGLSIIVVPFIGLALNFTPWGIKLYPAIIAITLFNILTSLMGWYRRNKLPADKRFLLSFNLDFKWDEHSNRTKKILLAVISAVLFSLGILCYMIAFPGTDDVFTEFYLLGQDEKTSGYPQKLKVGEYGKVTVGVVNNEHHRINYRMEVRLEGHLIEEVISIALEHGGKWEKPVSFKANNPGQKIKVEFLLFREGDLKPYRKLFLWMDVVKGE